MTVAQDYTIVKAWDRRLFHIPMGENLTWCGTKIKGRQREEWQKSSVAPGRLCLRCAESICCRPEEQRPELEWVVRWKEEWDAVHASVGARLTGDEKLAKLKAEIERRRDRLVTWRDQVKALGDGEQARGFHQRSKEYVQLLSFIASLGEEKKAAPDREDPPNVDIRRAGRED